MQARLNAPGLQGTKSIELILAALAALIGIMLAIYVKPVASDFNFSEGNPVIYQPDLRNLAPFDLTVPGN